MATCDLDVLLKNNFYELQNVTFVILELFS